MATALVTGATGFLGRRLAERLHRDGWNVTGFGRDTRVGAELQASDIRFAAGDLRDSAAVADACASQDVVFHCGALSSPWGAYRDFYDCNVAGTRHVANGCLQHGVSRLIHVSTPSLYFDFRDRFDISETDPLPPRPVNYYAATKRLAEREIQRACTDEGGGLQAIVLRPRALYGPGDRTLLPRLIEANASGGIPLMRGGGVIVDMTHVDNVVHALLLAAGAPQSAYGLAYNITDGSPMPLLEALRQLFQQLGEPMRTRKLPHPLAHGAAACMEWAAHWRGGGSREPRFTRYTVGVLAYSQTLDLSRARSRLGYKPVAAFEDGIRQFAEWRRGR